MKEVYKDIKDYEGRYQVSNMGNVMSLNYNHTGKKRLLKPKKEKNGYLRVQLWQEGKLKQCYIHRLVAQAFLENPHNLPQINHKDQNKENNIVSNLEYCSSEYNNNYGTRTERQAEKLSIPIFAIDCTTGLIEEFVSAMEASRQLKVNRSGIVNCLKGRCKTYKGFQWFYAKQDTNKNTKNK